MSGRFMQLERKIKDLQIQYQWFKIQYQWFKNLKDSCEQNPGLITQLGDMFLSEGVTRPVYSPRPAQEPPIIGTGQNSRFDKIAEFFRAREGDKWASVKEICEGTQLTKGRVDVILRKYFPDRIEQHKR